jgi:predicted phosphohydrolase
LTNGGSFEELQAQLDWLKSLPHRYKVVIAGNHDLLLDPAFVARSPDRICEGEGTSRSDLGWGDIVYLNNSTTKLNFATGRSLTVYGSPWTEQCGNWAFQYPPIRKVWADSVPQETDILVTHGPPKGYLDEEGKGCPQLLREIWRIRPRLVVFGHIHGGHGRENIVYDSVDAAYARVMTGERGALAVCWMGCVFVYRLLVAILPGSNWSFWRQRSCSYTTLVNAAVLRNNDGQEEEQPAVVVEI